METRFLWQGWRLLQSREGERCATYLYEPNETWSPLARVDHPAQAQDGECYWFTADLNGAPLEVTDADGAVRWSGQYGSFGEVSHQTAESWALRQGKPTINQPLRYAGQYADSETGLHYNLFRYYDPGVGRFTTQDPIGLQGGLNLYQYAPNPLGWVDPLGLKVLYRGVSIAEYDDLMIDGKWKVGSGTMEGKWFAESYKDAVTWGNKMGHGGEHFQVVQIDVPDDIAEKMHMDPRLDGIGPARYGELTDINNDRVKVTWSKRVKARTTSC